MTKEEDLCRLINKHAGVWVGGKVSKYTIVFETEDGTLGMVSSDGLATRDSNYHASFILNRLSFQFNQIMLTPKL